MDPNETLKAIRELIPPDKYLVNLDEASELQELISALDTWLTNGGFKPEAWGE